MESIVVFKLSSLIFYKLIYNGKQTGLTTKFLKRLSTEALCTVETQLWDSFHLLIAKVTSVCAHLEILWYQVRFKVKKLRVKLEASLPDQTSVDSHLSLVIPLGQVKMVYLGIHPSRIYFAGNWSWVLLPVTLSL